MRYLPVVLGGLLALSGAVWTFQGIGLLLGSPMTNQPFWAVAGAVTVVLGVALLAAGIRRVRAVPGKPGTDR